MRNIRLLVLGVLFCFAGQAIAQKKEVNPNLDGEWRFVRSQEMDMPSGNFYSFEFPAEEGYDYIFNLTHNDEKLFAAISVYDMQEQLVEKNIMNESNSSADLNFVVKASGTYKVIVGLTDPQAQKGSPIPVQFSLIRRRQL